MSPPGEFRKDLVVLVADSDVREGIAALLARHAAIGTRPITFDIFKHDDRDPGCRAKAADYLRPQAQAYAYALVMFDRHGCGSVQSACEIEDATRESLERSGWPGRCEVVVLDPEIEAWVWGPSRTVAECLGWLPTQPPLRDWLLQQGLWNPAGVKPADPKAAVERVLREVGKRRSSRLYALLAERVTTRGCRDPSFNRFCEILRRWFPPEGDSAE
mgnify:CR=1 FL=1